MSAMVPRALSVLPKTLSAFALTAAMLLQGCAATPSDEKAPDRYMIFFDRNSAELRPDEPVIAEIAKNTKDDMVLIVAGFADPKEKAGMDVMRTNAVADKIALMGVSQAAIQRRPGGTNAAVVIGDTTVPEGSYRVEVFYGP